MSVLPTRDEVARFNAPPVPPETCPEVDALYVLLDAIGADLTTFLDDTAHRRRKTYDREEVRELLLQTTQSLAGAQVRVEFLRNANDQLRTSGRYWREAFRSLAVIADASL